MIKTNALLLTDAYKLGHKSQYPEGTNWVVSNFTPRSAKHAPTTEDTVVVFGIQSMMKELIHDFNVGFFNRDIDEVLSEYISVVDTFVGDSEPETEHFKELHKLGYLPIEIRQMFPEGSQVKVGTPVLTIHNTKDEYFWLVNFLETYISSNLWKSMTAATIAKSYRNIVDKYSKITSAAEWFSAFQCHDFSSRGLSCTADINKTGSAHLTSFEGTDSLSAVLYVKQMYSSKVGASVPATEHSVMCMGTKQNEEETFRRLLTDVYPTGIVSIVSDTWDYWNVLTNTLPVLKDVIMQRFGKCVIRPDSGDPVDIICGTANAVEEHQYDGTVYYYNGKYYKDAIEVKPTPEEEGSVSVLSNIFGYTVTDTGYKTLDQHIGLIYGDSITLKRCNEILHKLMLKGFASDNVVFGVGSYSYQYITRDSFGFAMKATYGEVNGIGREIFKNPKTDSGVKKSIKGLFVVDESGVRQGVSKEEFLSMSNVVFNNGKLMNEVSMADIRAVLHDSRIAQNTQIAA